MAYSRSLADRVRDGLRTSPRITEQRLFGGLGFLQRGHLLAAVWQSSLVVRLGVEGGARALNESHVRPFDVTGRPLAGWVIVDPEGLDDDRALREWLERAEQFVSTLPPK